MSDAEPRVLFVDDDPIARELALTLLGVDVTIVADGREALGMLEPGRFDVLVLDLEMPHLDGYAVLEQVRAAEAICDMPVVVVTSRGDDWTKDQVRRRGADAYFSKPVHWSDLSDTVRRLHASRAACAPIAA